MFPLPTGPGLICGTQGESTCLLRKTSAKFSVVRTSLNGFPLRNVLTLLVEWIFWNSIWSTSARSADLGAFRKLHREPICLFLLPSSAAPAPGFSLARASQPPPGLGEWLPDRLEHSLPLMLPPFSAVFLLAFPSRLPQPLDLSNVLKLYHDLAEVISKRWALWLPLHCPYDSGIDLLPGAPLSSSQLFNLSRPEWESMEGYIGESLASGFICPSCSLVGAGIFKKFFFYYNRALTTEL